jgi:hypothetical protein
MKSNRIFLAMSMVFLFMGNTMLFTQQTFSYIIPPDTITPDGRVPTAWGTSVIALDSGKLMLVESRYQNPDSVYREIMVRVFDASGKEVRKRRYFSEGTIWNNNSGTVAMLENGEIILYNLVIDDYRGQGTGLWYSSFMKLDQNGDSLWLRMYDLGEFEQLFAMAKTQDTSAIAVGYHRNRGSWNPRQPLVVKIDQHGDTVWTHKESHEHPWYYLDIATNGLEFMLLGDWQYDDASRGRDDYYQAVTTTLLERGPYAFPNRYWGKIDETAYGQQITSYIDYGFLMLTIEPDTILRNGYSPRTKQKLRRLDYEGKEIWVQDIEFDTSYPINNRFVLFIRSLPNGDIILSGEVELLNGYRPIYIQRRTEQGVVLWERWISPCEQCNPTILDLEVLPDGYAISGSVVTRDQGQRAFIMRTDSTGCLEPGCPDRQGPFVSVEQEQDVLRLSIYPNPASNFARIEAERPVSLELFDIQGKRIKAFPIKQRHLIDVRTLPSGLYFYKASDSQGRSVNRKFVKE